MNPQLDAAFIASLKTSPFQFTFRDRVFTLMPSSARFGDLTTCAVVVENGESIGYLIEYSNREVGACRVNLIGLGITPPVVGHLSSAMSEILGPISQ